MCRDSRPSKFSDWTSRSPVTTIVNEFKRKLKETKIRILIIYKEFKYKSLKASTFETENLKKKIQFQNVKILHLIGKKNQKFKLLRIGEKDKIEKKNCVKLLKATQKKIL